MIRKGKKAVAIYLAVGMIALTTLAGMLPAPTQSPSTLTPVTATVTPAAQGAHLVP